jgi:hypothetical protein
MKYYLKHLFKLYVDYIKLAFSGMALCSVLITGYAALRTGNLVYGFSIAILLFAMLTALSVIWGRGRRSLKQELERSSLARRQEERLQKELQATRALERMAELRLELEKIQTESLVNELVVLREHLESLDASESLVKEAVELFLALQERLGYTTNLSSLRQKVIQSVTPKLRAEQDYKKVKDRKIAG